MNRHIVQIRYQQGSTVVTALLLITLAVTIVASLFWHQQVLVRSIENQRLQLQMQWVLRGALDWARVILREDAKFSRIDHLNEPWTVPLADTRLEHYVESGAFIAEASDASLTGHIIDAQSRLNLTNLSFGGKLNQTEILAFGRLLTLLGVNPGLAQTTAEAMASAQKKTLGTGERPASKSTEAAMNIVQVDDLLTIPGFSPDTVGMLKNYVVVLPRHTPVNLNTAPPEVLAARVEKLSLSDATAMALSRERTFFGDVSDFMSRLPEKKVSGFTPNTMSVETNFFIVNGKVRLDRGELEIQALVERNGLSTRVIWIRES